MSQAAIRRGSAVRKQHAAHPSRPKPAEKPGTAASNGAGTSASTNGGGERHSRRGGTSRSGAGDRNKRSGKPESKLAALVKDKKPDLPGLGHMSLPKPHLSIWTRLAGKVLKKVAKHELKRLTEATNWNLESVAGDELGELKDKLGGVTPGIGMAKPQLPIQESVDVAVPLDFAWSQWMELQFLPEGVDRVVDIERQDGALSGQIAGAGDTTWSAEVLDERERESFAWKSTEGSDCAGLVTFHSLSERLTRLELTLDVLPQDAKQAALLLSHVAHRRARQQLRRFKADLETVSPDVYAADADSASQ